MGNFASENVKKKAESMLHNHALVIKEIDNSLQLKGGSYYLNKKGTDDYIQFGYDISNKFLTKLYNISVKIVSHNITLGADFEAACVFKGIFRVEGAYFKRLKGDAGIVDWLNSQDSLINRICEASRKFEIESVRIRHSKENGILEVKIKPYAGALVWIRFPPVMKTIPLFSDELQEIYHLSTFIQNYY